MSTLQTLHIPDLISGGNALVYWKHLSGATEYELDCCLDEPFDTAQKAYSWHDIEDRETEWDELGETTWEAIASVAALGLTWNIIDTGGGTWAQRDGKEHSWRDCLTQTASFTVYRGPGVAEDALFIGLAWHDVAARGKTWQQGEAAELDWAALEELIQRGLTWGGFEARFLDAAAWETGITSWDEFEALDDSLSAHRGCTVFVPGAGTFLWFRLRALNAQGNWIDYLYSAQLPICYTDTVMVSDPEEDNPSLQICARQLKLPDTKQIQILYNPYHLQIETKPSEGTSAVCVKPLSGHYGKIRLRSDIQGSTDEDWSGLLADLACGSISKPETELKLVTHKSIV